MAMSLTYNGDLARVQIALSGIAVDSVRIEQSINGLLWQTVRGAVALPVVAGNANLDSYEFVWDIENFYRVRDADPLSETILESDSITPDSQGETWLKSIQFPFMNRPIEVASVDVMTRQFRGGIFDISGRSFPVAVTDIRGSRGFVLPVVTQTLEEERDLDLILAANTIMLIQPPTEDTSGCGPVGMTPGGYVVIETTQERRPLPGERTYLWQLPCRIVAAPGPDIIPTTMTWGTVFALYGSWGPLIAANPTWGDLLATVGDPDDLVVL